MFTCSSRSHLLDVFGTAHERVIIREQTALAFPLHAEIVRAYFARLERDQPKACFGR